MNPNRQPLIRPRVLLFDWHGTLVDTLDAMFAAMEELLPQLEELDLIQRLQPESACRTPDDAKLVRYIRIFRRLHPRILAERRVSRTDIFNAIFGADREAKHIAHQAYNQCYSRHVGAVKPFQEGVYDYLRTFQQLGIRVAVATNRSREFLDRELALVDGGRWAELFDTTVCANDISEYKPSPQLIFAALEQLGETADAGIWYVGDSYSDMETAHNAQVTAIFYNGLRWESGWFRQLYAENAEKSPHAVIDSFEGLTNLIGQAEGICKDTLNRLRPAAYPPPSPPPPRIEPDWHPAVAKLAAPKVILFDWHATLVDTIDAMYRAVDDMLPEFNELGLTKRLMSPNEARSPEDAKLVEYVRQHAALHPKIKADRKISRTDIFEVLFGDDQEAKQIAHKRFNFHYRNHFGTVRPFEPNVRQMLSALRALPIKVGVITNRDREFFEQEIAAVENTGWTHLFDTDVCGDDTPLRKPHPDQLLKAVGNLGYATGPTVWYVGDSTTDIISAKRAEMTGVFFNGAQWDLPWLRKIFPGTERHPHKPDVVVNDFSEFWALVLTCWGKFDQQALRER
ncbi:HAD family hydrolase [Alkalilimnicola ehrlichii]|uniref:phosphoglycolate phosphatase n=1 Tax=Alkalilimnicola ehrlichii TaxID=351052 RepID=A0A3E0WZ76_9GAMM|nr:HAD family hydrolase [Alkalilimnicola ehrlichii]RFA30754.1 HAD family hydrolase [Alkalilimnicola ehrlichii]RFA38330.1 HAD family hydrolase [Alkalilimnicola ehrlichii]